MKEQANVEEEQKKMNKRSKQNDKKMIYYIYIYIYIYVCVYVCIWYIVRVQERIVVARGDDARARGIFIERRTTVSNPKVWGNDFRISGEQIRVEEKKCFIYIFLRDTFCMPSGVCACGCDGGKSRSFVTEMALMNRRSRWSVLRGREER